MAQLAPPAASSLSRPPDARLSQTRFPSKAGGRCSRGVMAVGTERHPGGLLKAVLAPHLTPTGCPHWPITFCSASRSGLPCVNAKTGSLATFREDVCFHHILGYKGREQRHTGQWQLPPDPAPLPPMVGADGGDSGLAQNPEIQSKYRTGGARTGPGVQNPSSRPSPVTVCPRARDRPPLGL